VDEIELRRIADGVWVHTWWMEAPGWGRFSSNGLVVVSDDEALLIDTPVDDAMTERLLEMISDSTDATVRRAIVTHAHNDRMGGIGALKEAGVVCYALPYTADWGERQGWARPDSLLSTEQVISIGSRTVTTWFPGAGHSPDNLVVWLPDEKILHGGCLVKSEESQSIGNLGDAVVDEWPATIRKVQARFPDAAIVIPGHGSIGGIGALTRTLELLDAMEE
jgi:metallo-beta-lactamase class B